MTRQRDVAAPNAKYTGELTNAKAELGKLRGDVTAGLKRRQAAASCAKSNNTSAPGVDDVTRPLTY